MDCPDWQWLDLSENEVLWFLWRYLFSPRSFLFLAYSVGLRVLSLGFFFFAPPKAHSR